MNEDPSPILVVLLDPMILSLIILLECAKDKFLELSAAFAGNDLNALGFLSDRLVHDLFDGAVKLVAFGKDVVQV